MKWNITLPLNLDVLRPKIGECPPPIPQMPLPLSFPPSPLTMKVDLMLINWVNKALIDMQAVNPRKISAISTTIESKTHKKVNINIILLLHQQTDG